MWTKIKAFFWQDFEKAFGRKLSPVERWSLRNAKTCSADEIIAASIIQSFASHFEDWTLKDVDLTKVDRRDGRFISGNRSGPAGSILLINSKKNITVKLYPTWRKQESRDGDGLNPWFFALVGVKKAFVNDIEVSDSLATTVWASWARVERAHKRTEEAAARAKADMERNEKAWNLAERLLGMRRNEFGALVPIQTAE